MGTRPSEGASVPTRASTSPQRISRWCLLQSGEEVASLRAWEEETEGTVQRDSDHSPLTWLSLLASPSHSPLPLAQLTQRQVGDHTGEDEGRQEREGENKRIEEAVVPSPHTVAHPRAVMVKPFWKRARGDGLAPAWPAASTGVYRGLMPQLGPSYPLTLSAPADPQFLRHSCSCPLYTGSHCLTHSFLSLCLFTWLRVIPPPCLSCRPTSFRKSLLTPDKVRPLLSALLPWPLSSAALCPRVFTHLFTMGRLASEPSSIVNSMRGLCWPHTELNPRVQQCLAQRRYTKSTCCLVYDPGHMSAPNDPIPLLRTSGPGTAGLLQNPWRTGIRDPVRGLSSPQRYVTRGGVTLTLRKKVPFGNVGYKHTAGLTPRPAPFTGGGWGRFSEMNDTH